MSQYRKSDDSTICSCKIKTDSSKSMGLFVNQRNLPSVLEGNYDEAVESFTSSEPRMKIKRRPENCPFSPIFFTTAKPPNFLQSLQVTEEEPLGGYSFENTDPNDLGKGVRLASSTARSELSAVTASQLPTTTAKKRPGSILKESMDSLDLSGRSHLPDTMRHLIERIIKRQYSQHEIIQTTTSVLTEHADVDVIHLHLREKNDETYAKQIVQAEKCVLFLVDLEKQELISTIVDHGGLYQTNFVNVEPIRVPLNVGVFGHVIHTSECLVTNDPQSNDDFYHHEGIFSENFRILNMVTAPIRVRNEVVAVLQLFNKTPGEFDTNDVENIKDFSVFCGLALYISKMYEKMFRSEQKCRITMEIMLHHNLASDSDVVEYSVHEIPDNIPGITEPLFSPWHMPDEEMPAVFIYMVHDVMGKSVIDLHTLIRFTLTVRKNYRDVIYHNWFHGFSVAHGAYVEIKREDCNFTQVEKLCILIAALCHDLDHRGTDNSYQRKKGTPLATLYSTSILEHHHFNMTLTILQQPGNQIFAHVAGTSYYEILMIIKHAILSTDLGRLDASKEVVTDILDKRGAIDWDNKDHRMATVAIALPVADLCSMYKPWEVHKKVVLLVMEEMWAQGDEEKKNGFIPMDLMNRDLYYQIPEMQSNFYKVVCLPLFRLITRAIPSLMDIPNQAFANFSRWMEMCLLPESVKRERVNELIQRRSQRTTATTDSI
ncbi:cAMP and cAMP-inhibited cGMP 3',5'-cyclic phosphodiesterase [Echinococcus granulosus]|uniref:Phosphodiesterase n=1 Tax=Echinococcus granulosus TaxID=6210 RepID=W6UZT0_ECHGR|nr:cAMP and cAMP-inhibited cGMP 3',5'-cyclic phosphodiesterase [Echinococcus granulosus]EUB64062.1 cAMP and cAMP-inhibited cGMP 3',5'-cyclic phosphodiesterase [Echinococcus granulosus]